MISLSTSRFIDNFSPQDFIARRSGHMTVPSAILRSETKMSYFNMPEVERRLQK